VASPITRTPPRVIVGARYGLFDWIAQRVSAVVIAAFTTVLVVRLLLIKDLNYDSWAGLFGATWMKVLTLLTMLALLCHAWVGVRNIFMDYVKPVWLRLVLQSATVLILLGYAFWLFVILWRV
jgi:succinate dehydrogenase / fumarate reductase, membrane anchor subunit